MPPQFVNLEVDRAVDEILRHHDRGVPHIWARGSAGTGRSTLLHRLAGARPELRVVRAPTLGADAGLHVLIQLASFVAREHRGEATDETSPLADRARTIARRLATNHETVVFALPFTWATESRQRAPDAQRDRSEALAVLAAIVEAGVRLIVVSGPYLGSTGLPPMQTVRLSPPAVNWAALEDDTRWGNCSRFAKLVHDWFTEPPAGLFPVTVRMAVGALALGASAPEVQAILEESPSTFNAMLRVLIERLSRDERRARAVGRVACSRHPLPIATALEVAGLPDGDRTLLTECIGYGRADLRITEQLRQQLVNRFARPGLDRIGTQEDWSKTHTILAGAHRSLDGTARPEDAAPGAVVHWLERAHHTAEAGPAATALWDELEFQPRELLWQRGRSLSRDYQRYQDAADVFRQCTDRWPDHAYSWHYLGYNLDRGHLQLNDADRAYRHAIALEENNPWYNARYVAFLARRGRARAAIEEWERVRTRLSLPDTTADEWIARNVHVQVVHAWLVAGAPGEALEVLKQIGPELRDPAIADPELRALEQQVRDALEVEALGASVYPPEYPVSRRWRQPRELPPEHDGRILQAWYPARVTRFGQDSIHLVFATPDPPRRVLERAVSVDRWEDSTAEDLREVGDYYFIGVYEEGRWLIRRAPRGADPELQLRAYREGTGYWELWRRDDLAGT